MFPTIAFVKATTTNQIERQDDEITVNNNTSPLGKKRDVATMLNVSVRSVDNYIAEGCPHMKPTPRCVRFDLDDVRDWFKNKYGQQSRRPKTFSGN